MAERDPIRLFLCGDVMTGRGIDQVLPFPGDPILYESYLNDARRYVDLAERLSGDIPRYVDPSYIWGDALAELERSGVDARIINLETSITQSGDFWRDKGIHYRMNPRNIDCLAAARIDCCCLANNHILDWGYGGLEETLQTLDFAGIAYAGAGRNGVEASRPAVIPITGKGRVLVFSYGSPTSGIPQEWAATANRPGVNLLDEISPSSARRITGEMSRYKRAQDLVVASIHWGANWGYCLEKNEIQFAHTLIENGVSVVHGHSSHHVKTVELYDGRLVLYGCGDFLNDYEGIEGYEEFRSDLTSMYLADIDPRNGLLVEARLVPMRVARFRLNRAGNEDAGWLCSLLSNLGASFGTWFEPTADGCLIPKVHSVSS